MLTFKTSIRSCIQTSFLKNVFKNAQIFSAMQNVFSELQKVFFEILYWFKFKNYVRK